MIALCANLTGCATKAPACTKQRDYRVFEQGTFLQQKPRFKQTWLKDTGMEKIRQNRVKNHTKAKRRK